MFSTRLDRQTGVSLVEVIIFIVVVAVAIAGVLGALNIATRSSADPLIQKQALAVAESLLEEIELMPFTTCDPDDATASTGVCTSITEAIGPEAGETRYSATTPFDNVNDYHNFSMAGIRDITNTAIPALAAYTASVTVAQQALGGIAAANSLLITVTVTGPANTTVVLQGLRTRYAPTALP
jgi:MSHA pilin protein MshD